MERFVRGLLQSVTFFGRVYGEGLFAQHGACCCELTAWLQLTILKQVRVLRGTGSLIIATVVAFGGRRRPQQDLLALGRITESLEQECAS